MKKSDHGAIWTSPNYIERERYIAVARDLQKAAVKQIIFGLISKIREKSTALRRHGAQFAPASPAS